MKKFLMNGVGAAGVTYAVANMVYGNAEYADFGVSLVSADLLQKVLPIVVGIVFPMISAKWPGVGKLLTILMSFWKNNSSDITKLLDMINSLEVEAAKRNDSTALEACSELRCQTLKRLRDEEATA